MDSDPPARYSPACLDNADLFRESFARFCSEFSAETGITPLAGKSEALKFAEAFSQVTSLRPKPIAPCGVIGVNYQHLEMGLEGGLPAGAYEFMAVDTHMLATESVIPDGLFNRYEKLASFKSILVRCNLAARSVRGSRTKSKPNAVISIHLANFLARCFDASIEYVLK